MKIYLFQLSHAQPVFYAEGEDSDQSPEFVGPQDGGLFALLGKKYNDLQRTLRESESGIGLRMRRIWEWLHRRTAPDESLIRALRGATSAIELFYPGELSAAQARDEWEKYLRRRRRHFAFWLVVNIVITPLTLLLAPIPGPNIIGYWFTYRAICHALALLGIRRAGEVGVELREASELNFYLDEADDEHLARAGQAYDLRELDAFAARQERRAVATETEKLAISSR